MEKNRNTEKSIKPKPNPLTPKQSHHHHQQQWHYQAVEEEKVAKHYVTLTSEARRRVARISVHKSTMLISWQCDFWLEGLTPSPHLPTPPSTTQLYFHTVLDSVRMINTLPPGEAPHWSGRIKFR